MSFFRQPDDKKQFSAPIIINPPQIEDKIQAKQVISPVKPKKILDKKPFIEKLWVLADVKNYLSNIINALSKNDMSLLTQHLYDFGIYHTNNTMLLHKEINDTPNSNDFIWLSSELSDMSNALTNQCHEIVHYALHIAQHHYRSLEKCDIYLRHSYEAMSSGLTAYMDLLYPVNSLQEKKLLSTRQSVIQPKIDKESTAKSSGKQEDEFMVRNSRPMINKLSDISVEVKREQIERLDFKPYIHINQLTSYTSKSNKNSQEIKNFMTIYNQYYLNRNLSNDQLIQLYKTRSTPVIKLFIQIRGTDDIISISEDISSIKQRLIELEMKLIEDCYNEIKNSKAFTLFTPHITEHMQFTSFKDRVDKYFLHHFRINNFDHQCSISEIEFTKLCYFIIYIDMISYDCYLRNHKFFKPYIDSLNTQISNLLKIIPNPNFHENLLSFLRNMRETLIEMNGYYVDHAGGAIIPLVIQAIEKALPLSQAAEASQKAVSSPCQKK